MHSGATGPEDDRTIGNAHTDENELERETTFNGTCRIVRTEMGNVHKAKLIYILCGKIANIES